MAEQKPGGYIYSADGRYAVRPSERDLYERQTNACYAFIESAAMPPPSGGATADPNGTGREEGAGRAPGRPKNWAAVASFVCDLVTPVLDSPILGLVALGLAIASERWARAHQP